ncbi:MAG: hypothetical protein SWQ30_21845 [Thermodesulfobacteriota bacterium]|nr:hypothetical protein [Thermodesulfobacteriota bacterium]
MTDWEDVERREHDEQTFANETADRGAPEIERFYPELHSSTEFPSFTNSLGSLLIPDLLTSQHVVVDLYDWPSPDHLIEIYGVDLQFLLALRDANLITVCANLPAHRYKKCSWMYPLLSDRRTIFRSVRTPAFIGALDRDFERRRSKRESDLVRHFQSLPGPEIERLCGAVPAAHPPTDAHALAAVLAQWVERVASFDRKISEELGDGIEHNVVERVPELRRIQRLIVSPYTAALGAMMKIERRRWVDLFGEESIETLLIEGHLRLQSLNSSFSEVELRLDEVDLTSGNVWKAVRHVERQQLIDHLGDQRRKSDLIAAEEEIRIALAKGGNSDPTRADIKAYVDKLQREVDDLHRLAILIGIGAPVAFGFVHESIVAGLSVASGIFSSRLLLKERLRIAAEHALGKMRVVRLLGRDSKK